MNVLQAAERTLINAGTPLHYKTIAQNMIEHGLWQTDGKTPDATVNAKISVDIKQKGMHSLFQRTGKGIFALRNWGLPEFHEANESDEQVDTEDNEQPETHDDIMAKPLSFTDATEQVLKQFGNNTPMHYRDITKKALELNLIKTKGLTPEATLYSQILSEIRRQTRRGSIPRFAIQKGGLVGLTSKHQMESTELAAQIEHHNHLARKKFHNYLLSIPPKDFEELTSQLLAALGFENVIVTSYSNDGGIDVRGTLVVGDVIRVNMAVQVKRWKSNVHAPIVQQMRGSLGIHDQGLIITTSDFSHGASEEAQRSNAVPVALMNGDQLVALLIEHNIGVNRIPYELIELKESSE